MANKLNLGMATSLAASLLLFAASANALTTQLPTTQAPTDQAPTQGPPAPQVPDPEPAEYQQALRLLSIMNSAFANDQVNEVTKTKLFNCMFFNSLRTLNNGVQQTFVDNPGLSFDNNVHVFRIATAVCGVTAEELAIPSAPPAQTPQGTTPQNQAPGR